jgi:CspA family cold shock protein
MKTGTVVKWNDAAGFGFIRPSEGGPDLFCHYSTVQMDGRRTLVVGQEVTYSTEIGGPQNRLQACDVRVVYSEAMKG